MFVVDGGSTDYAATIEAARLLREQGVDIMVIGIGNWLNYVEMYEIATDPDNVNVLMAPTAADLETFRSFVKSSICRGILKCILYFIESEVSPLHVYGYKFRYNNLACQKFKELKRIN